MVKRPSADKLAKIEALDTRARARRLLDMLGGAASVRLELDCLAPV